MHTVIHAHVKFILTINYSGFTLMQVCAGTHY